MGLQPRTMDPRSNPTPEGFGPLTKSSRSNSPTNCTLWRLSLLMFGPITEYLNLEQSEKDPTGLGRWSVMTVMGSNGSQTRIVCGYNPCYNRNPNSSTSYQQHQQYLIMQQKDLTCMRTKFCKDLMAQLRWWRQDRDKLIVCLDANEDIYHKLIGKVLKDINRLAMKEVVGELTCQPVSPTLFWGSKPSGHHQKSSS
jgi:hypothetical protein